MTIPTPTSTLIPIIATTFLSMACSGYCARCNTVHTLPTTPGSVKALQLLRYKLLPYFNNNSNNNNTDDNINNADDFFDFSLPDHWWSETNNKNEKNDASVNDTTDKDHQKEDTTHSPSLSSTSLSSFNEPEKHSNSTTTTTTINIIKRGKMIGVLEVYNTTSNEISYLAGYAGKLNGQWLHAGWVPPIMIPESVAEFQHYATIVSNMTQHISTMENEHAKEELMIIAEEDDENHKRCRDVTTATNNTNHDRITRLATLKLQRKQYATAGIRALQHAQRVHNFRNESVTIVEAYCSTGTHTNTSNSNRNDETIEDGSRRRGHRDAITGGGSRKNKKRQRRKELWKAQQQQLRQHIEENPNSHQEEETSNQNNQYHRMPPLQQLKMNSNSNNTNNNTNTNTNKNTNNNNKMKMKKSSMLPGGVGDCAAPKLLHAIHTLSRQQQQNTTTGTSSSSSSSSSLSLLGGQHVLQPIGIAEMFVGPTGGMSQSKYDNTLYDACQQRCQPIMGYMLCGLLNDGSAKQSRIEQNRTKHN